MDGSRFDRITRALAPGATRRRALLGIAGSAVALLMGQIGVEEATAACIKPGKKGCQGPQHRQCCAGARCKGGSNTKEGRCACKGRLTKCGTKCVDTKTNRQHCGACNRGCAASGPCIAGQCPCPKEAVCDGFASPCGRAGSGCTCHFTEENSRACATREFAICEDFPTCTATSQCDPGEACMLSCCTGGRCVPLCGSGTN
jgi:hypothetical protein